MNKFFIDSAIGMFIFTQIFIYFNLIYYKKYGIIPNYLLNLSYSISYNSIYYYSKLQLGFIKTQNIITNYAKSVPFLNNLLTYFNPEKSIYTYTIINEHFAICSKHNREKNMDYKIIINEILNDEEKKNIENSVIEEANYKFIMTEIIIADKKFIIHFTTDKYNYLIINNGLDSEFIVYFLKTHYNEFIKDLDLVVEKYTIKIIDHNVNIVEFDNTKLLCIEKDDYIITENK